MTARRWSIRAQLLTMIAVATIPPILIGFTQIRSAGRVGRALLETQLDEQLDQLASGIRARWSYRHGTLLLLAGNEVTRVVLSSGESPKSFDLDYVRELASRADGVDDAVLVNGRGVGISLTGEEAAGDAGPARLAPSGALPVTVPVLMENGRRVGEVRAQVALSSLLPLDVVRDGKAVVSVFDSSGADPLATPAIPAELLRRDTFEWAGETWLVRRRAMTAPALSLVVASSLDPFVRPFERAARDRTIALMLGSLVALALAATLASRLSRSVSELASAADDIAQGNLDKRIVVNGSAEVARLAASFNRMTSTLEDTLRQLSNRASLAAVGEFATSLAHEIRNPLTAVRVDLQHLMRHGSPALAERDALSRAVRQVDRLDNTVSAALDLARGGQARLTPVKLDLVIRDAIAAAEPAASARVRLLYEPINDGLIAFADAGALHQVMLNLLLNAVQSYDAEGEVRVVSSATGDRITVTITDRGRGIPAGDLSRVFDPFYTTRPGGSGLGLAIARRIAISHGGDITIAAGVPNGTVATVTLRGP